MSEFVVDTDGYRRFSPEKLKEVLTTYLKPVEAGVMLSSTELTAALLFHGTTVVEADNQFVLASHLRTALGLRGDTTLPWDMVTPDIAMSRFIEGAPEVQSAMVEFWDPLVILAFVWPDYLKASLKLGHICRTRAVMNMPTLFVVRDLKDLPSLATLFDPDFMKWLLSCPRVRLTVGSISQLARDASKAKTYLHSHPAASRALRPVVRSEPKEKPAPSDPGRSSRGTTGASSPSSQPDPSEFGVGARKNRFR